MLVLATAMIIPACGDGSDDGVPPAAPSATLTGVAALGAPLALQAVEAKDRDGHTVSGTTAADGSYSLAIGGFTAPFLVRVSYNLGADHLLSIGTATGTQTVNVHVLTDLVVKAAFAARGTLDANAAYTGSPALWPQFLPEEISALARQARGIVAPVMVASGEFTELQAGAYDLLYGPLTANSTGFDKILDGTTSTSSGAGPVDFDVVSTVGLVVPKQVQVRGKLSVATGGSGSVTVTAKTTYYETGGAPLRWGTRMAPATETASNGGYDAIVPQSGALATALTGIQTLLDAVAGVVNTEGSALSSTHLHPYFFPQYDPAGPTAPPFFMHDGDDRDTHSAAYAQFLRGKTITSMNIDQVLDLDLAATPSWVKVRITRVMLGEQWPSEEVVAYDAGASAWKFYGNQRFWFQNWKELARSRLVTASGGPTYTYLIQPMLQGWVSSTGTLGVSDGEDVLVSADPDEPTFQLDTDPAQILSWFDWGSEDIEAAPGVYHTYTRDGWQESSPLYSWDATTPGTATAYLGKGGLLCTVSGKIRRTTLPTAAGTVETESFRIAGVTSEFADPVISIPGGTSVAGSATSRIVGDVVGKTLTITWTSPKTFVQGAANCGLWTSTDGGATWSGGEAPRTVTAGTAMNEFVVPVPAGVNRVNLSFWIFGVNGEAMEYQHEWIEP